MIISCEEHASWTPWLVPGDVLIHIDTNDRYLVLVVDKTRDRCLLTKNSSAEWMTDYLIDRALQRDQLLIMRSDHIVTRGLRGLPLSART